MTHSSSNPWLFIADSNVGRLMRLSVTEHGRPQIENVAELTNEWKTGEHGRPSPLAGKNARTNAVPPASEDDRRHHFAKELAQWLESQVNQHNITALNLHAAPRFLGELRKVLPKKNGVDIVEHEGDLTSLPNKELREHPAVTDLLSAEKSN